MAEYQQAVTVPAISAALDDATSPPQGRSCGKNHKLPYVVGVNCARS
jgi:hypothetical protein